MTYPCVNETQFDMTDGAISPKDFMQWRHVATNTAPSIGRSYPPTGPAINDALHTVQAQWTNTSPLPQRVYALLTRSGSQVVLMMRSRAYIETGFGTAVGAAPADPATTTVHGRFGIGGTTATSGENAPYIVLETRMGERTTPIGAHTLVPAGQQFKARVALSFKSDNWENLPTFLGGNIELEAKITTGATQIDLFAYPVIT